MGLFATLMNTYFTRNKYAARPEAVRQRVLLLRLVALNFEDAPIYLKPLFEDLDKQLTTARDRRALRGVAQEVARRQAFRMTVDGIYDSGKRVVRRGDSLAIPVLSITVKTGEVSPDGVDATIYSTLIRNGSVGPFTVTYFDTPLVDNIIVGDYRVALLLLDSGRDQAEMRVVVFPRHLADDRFDIKELSRSFRDTVKP